jgi:hypothetical protein
MDEVDGGGPSDGAATLREIGDCVVLGGGLLGAAIARHAQTRAQRVVVASRTPRPHAALWRAFEANSPPRGLVPRGASVFLTLSPGPRDDAQAFYGVAIPRLVGAAWRDGASRVTLVGPAGHGHPLTDAFTSAVARLPERSRVGVLRVTALFGTDDACLFPLLRSLREHGAARVPAGLPPAWALHVDDAARAVWRSGAGERTLRGPARVHVEEAVDAAIERFGGSRARRWVGGRGSASILSAQLTADDDWSTEDGGRTEVRTWISRLPGLRRRR